MRQVIVIGGGASGMMAAYAAAGQGARVTLLEQNEKLGKKLFITGKGRCNVTNNHSMEEHMKCVCSNPKFLYSAFRQFDKDALMELLTEYACPLKVERGERVFPVSDHSSDVIGAFQRMLKAKKVDVKLHTQVRELILEDGVCKGVALTDGKKIYCDSVIVATGGLSYASTGATGDGYRFAGQLGHRIEEPKPSLVALETKEAWVPSLMGLTLKNVTVSLKIGKKEYYREQGELLFTHFGVSGPLGLTASCYFQKYREKGEARLTLDLKPALSMEQLDARLVRELTEQSNKQFKNALSSLFPASMIPMMVELSGISPEKKCRDISKEERTAFASLIKGLDMTLTDTRPFAEAIITQGGVSVREIDPKTMASKQAAGVYFAGEVMDLDAFTGGYNLQIAWSTGYVAGINAAKEKDDELFDCD